VAQAGPGLRSANARLQPRHQRKPDGLWLFRSSLGAIHGIAISTMLMGIKTPGRYPPIAESKFSGVTPRMVKDGH